MNSQLIIVLLKERITGCSFCKASLTWLPRLTEFSGILHYLVDVACEVGIHDPCVWMLLLKLWEAALEERVVPFEQRVVVSQAPVLVIVTFVGALEHAQVKWKATHQSDV